MKSRRLLVAGSWLVVSAIAACNSVDRSAPDGSAGAAGTSLGGTTANGGDSGTGTSAGQSAGGSGGQASSPGGASGSASAGTSAGGGAGATGAGGGTDSGGLAGMGPGAAGEAGSVGMNEPPPLLKNGSFELGGLAGWQVVVTPDVGKAIYTQWPNASGESIDGMYEVSFWNGTAGFKGDLHQTITGLTPGKYELKLYIAYGLGLNSAYLYAIGCGPTDVRIDLPLTDGVATFTPTSIPTIDVTGDTCTIGLFADMNTGDWLNADAFVFDALPAQ
jgi:hypothetical protein